MKKPTEIERAAPKIAKAAPKTLSAVVSFIKSVVLPILAPSIRAIIAKSKNDATIKQYLIETRDVLNEVYPPKR